MLGKALGWSPLPLTIAGRKIELLYEDSTGRPDTGLTKIKALVERDKVHLLLSELVSSIGAAVAVGSPDSLAYGAGSVWAVGRTDGTVSRINPATHAVVQTIPVGTDPAAVTGHVRFEGVGFTYPGADRPALDGIDLHIDDGPRFAADRLSSRHAPINRRDRS